MMFKAIQLMQQNMQIMQQASIQQQNVAHPFRVKCNNNMCTGEVSYADDMIAGQLIAALANVEHQGKALEEASSLKTLKEKFDKLVSLETTDQATSHLHIRASN